jgi:uncharacterized membrane protein
MQLPESVWRYGFYLGLSLLLVGLLYYVYGGLYLLSMKIVGMIIMLISLAKVKGGKK